MKRTIKAPDSAPLPPSDSALAEPADITPTGTPLAGATLDGAHFAVPSVPTQDDTLEVIEEIDVTDAIDLTEITDDLDEPSALLAAHDGLVAVDADAANRATVDAVEVGARPGETTDVNHADETSRAQADGSLGSDAESNDSDAVGSEGGGAEGSAAEGSTADGSGDERPSRKRLEEQLEALKRKETELRRALVIADHPELADAIRLLQGRAYAIGRVEAKLAQGLSKAEARRSETIDKKLAALRTKRAELDTQIAELEAELSALGAERTAAFERERDEALEQLLIALGTHEPTLRAAGIDASTLVPELSPYLPAIEGLAEKLVKTRDEQTSLQNGAHAE